MGNKVINSLSNEKILLNNDLSYFQIIVNQNTPNSFVDNLELIHDIEKIIKQELNRFKIKKFEFPIKQYGGGDFADHIELLSKFVELLLLFKKLLIFITSFNNHLDGLMLKKYNLNVLIKIRITFKPSQINKVFLFEIISNKLKELAFPMEIIKFALKQNFNNINFNFNYALQIDQKKFVRKNIYLLVIDILLYLIKQSIILKK